MPIPEACPECGAEIIVWALSPAQAMRSGFWWKGACGTFMPLDGDTMVGDLCLARQESAALKAEIERLRNGFKAVIGNLQSDHVGVALENCRRALEQTGPNG